MNDNDNLTGYNEDINQLLTTGAASTIRECVDQQLTLRLARFRDDDLYEELMTTTPSSELP